MFSKNEKITSILKSQFEANLTYFNGLASQYILAVDRLSELNITALKSQVSSIEKSSINFLAPFNPSEIMENANAKLKQQVDSLSTYNQHLQDITESLKKGVADTAEAHTQKFGASIKGMSEHVAILVPATPESSIAFVKAAIEKASSDFVKSGNEIRSAVEKMTASGKKVK
jgi:phasin family protein